MAQAEIHKESLKKVKVRNAVAIASALTVRALLFPLNKLILASDLLASVQRRIGQSALDVLRRRRRRHPDDRFSFWAYATRSSRHLYILDARRPDEYAASHIPTATNFHYELGQDLPKEIEELDRETPVVTYCAVGLRSGAFARRLRRMGFKHVYVLRGGFYRWANLGYPLASSKGYLVRNVKSQHALASILLRQDLKVFETHNAMLAKKRHFLRRHAARMRRRQYARLMRHVIVRWSSVRPNVPSVESQILPTMPQSETVVASEPTEKASPSHVYTPLHRPEADASESTPPTPTESTSLEALETGPADTTEEPESPEQERVPATELESGSSEQERAPATESGSPKGPTLGKESVEDTVVFGRAALRSVGRVSAL